MNHQPPIDDKSRFVCWPGENVLSAIEKCLDNGLGVCFVVDQAGKLVGRLDLEDLRQALREGALLADGSLANLASRCQSSYSAGANQRDSVRPVLDSSGRLLEVTVDRSRRPVQIARPDLSRAEFRLALDAFMSSWISSAGAYVKQFQENFAGFIGRRHGVAVSNGTAALHLSLVALGIGPGDEVILPDLTFAATINAVIHCGARPVIVDIDPVTWGLSAETVAPALTPRTKAIIPVHLYGRPVAMEPLLALARAHGLCVVEDCAEAIGARHAGRMVGSFGEVACFSFFANKTITTGEGGMSLTDSPALAERLTELRDHGMARGRRYWHERVGYNYRMTNPQAAIGVAQLGRIQDIFTRNRRLETLYRRLLGELPEIAFPAPLSAGDEASIWLVSVLVPSAMRAQIIDAARIAEIELRPFFYPLSEMPPYREYGRDCPVSRALSRAGLNLPTSDAVDLKVIERLKAVLWDVLGRHAA
jgi:perosamine synthetase